MKMTIASKNMLSYVVLVRVANTVPSILESLSEKISGGMDRRGAVCAAGTELLEQKPAKLSFSVAILFVIVWLLLKTTLSNQVEKTLLVGALQKSQPARPRNTQLDVTFV
jgi:hypothetical protein